MQLPLEERIRSAHKWPEKVIMDTSRPTITPPAVEEPPAAQSPFDRPMHQGSRKCAAQRRHARLAASLFYARRPINRFRQQRQELFSFQFSFDQPAGSDDAKSLRGVATEIV
jgi:hypothetical protein